MKAVRVQYTVKPEYTEQNKANVQEVMDDLRNNPIEGMRYSTFYFGDGRFMHINICKDQETMSLLAERSSFKRFRTGLKASLPVSPPKSEPMELVGANFDFL